MYVTYDEPCDIGKTCYKRLYVKSHTGTDKSGFPKTLTYDEPSNPVAADVDNDSDIEIIFVEQIDTSERESVISCYENDGSVCSDYPYDFNDGLSIGIGLSPSIADIDGDGYEDMIIQEYQSRNLYIINPEKTSSKIPLGGKISNNPAIGDIDNDGNAEIAVPRKGSPFAILSVAEEDNIQPVFTFENHSIVAIAGEEVFVNTTGRIQATDPDSDALEFSYSYPFNESGQWIPTVNDTGNYITVVEARDTGNLTDIMYVDLIVFDNSTNKITTFADNTTSKILTYTGSETKTVQIRLPKDINIKLARFRLEGRP
jgi:hypothetical protein